MIVASVTADQKKIGSNLKDFYAWWRHQGLINTKKFSLNVTEIPVNIQVKNRRHLAEAAALNTGVDFEWVGDES